MSVIIRSTEMPNCCYMCWALDDCGDYPRCRITQEQRGYNFPVRDKRMDTCPLIELPAEHGRLIDAEWLKFAITIALEHLTRHPLMSDKGIAKEIIKSAFKTIESIADDIPTIIPAEKEEIE